MADLTITAANVRVGANAKRGRATPGATLTAGMALYKDAAASKVLKPTDADAVATAECVGLAMQNVASGQDVEYVYEDDDYTPGATLIVGETYVVSTTPGGICPIADLASGDFPTILFIAKSATKAKLKIHVGGVAKA